MGKRVRVEGIDVESTVEDDGHRGGFEENMSKFIGGCADGRDVAVDPRSPRVMMRVPQKPGYDWKPKEVYEDRVETEVYRREQIRGEGCVFVVMVEESVTPDQMLAKLIDGYRPEDPAVVHRRLMELLKTQEKLIVELSEECVEAGVRPSILKRADMVRALFKELKERYNLE